MKRQIQRRETADDSYETAEIAGEDVEAAQKTTGDSSQDDLRKQHIKTTALVAGIVVLLILLLLLPMRKNRRLRRGTRVKEKRTGKKDRKLLWGTIIISMILSLMVFYVLYNANNKYMTERRKGHTRNSLRRRFLRQPSGLLSFQGMGILSGCAAYPRG